MDQQKLQKFHNCNKHSKKKLKFIQVNQVKNNPTSNLFCCTDCINEDLDFKGINYLLIEQIVQQGENCILQKWPPVNNYQLIENLIKETKKFDKSQYVIQRITNYFNELRDEINRKIDYCQKQMINHALDLPFGNNQILKQYQQISQIQQLRSLIVESKNTQLDLSVELKFKNFISELELKKDENTQQLQKLLEESIQQQQLVNFDVPNMIKDNIFSLIDKIDFFNKSQITNFNSNNRNSSQNANNNISDKLMLLISNKSNYCSNEFLSCIRSQLDKLNPLFDKLSTENMFQLGKEPIKFDQINDQKMNEINDYVNHQIKLQNDQNYLHQISQSSFIQDIQKIIQSKLNFINQDSQQILNQHFIETYTFVKNHLDTQIFQQKDNFHLLNQMNEQIISDLTFLLKKKQLFENDGFKQSETLQIKSNLLFQKYNEVELERLFKQFPVFDIIPKDKINIINDFQLIKSSLQEGDKRIYVKKINDLNQYEIGIDEQNYDGNFKGNGSNCVSNIVLQQNKKYVFRIQLKSYSSDNQLVIGLMKEKNVNIQLGRDDLIYACFQLIDNKLQLKSQRISYTFLKGKDLEIEQEGIVELRIWLSGQIFQILDYPNYDFQATLNNQTLSQLQTMNDLKLFFQLYKSEQIYVITDALIVEEFDD